MAPKFPKFGELNSAERSQNPESLEPENLNGLDLISLNNSKATSPNILKKIIGPLKGIVIKGKGDQTSVQTGTSLFPFVTGKAFAKHRIRIPEIHAHLPEPEDYNDVPPTIACMYPEFIAQSSDIKSVSPGTYVWCDFLDRNNMEEPIYLGPVDPQATSTTPAGQASKSTTLSGTPPIGGAQQVANIRTPSSACSEPLNFSSCAGLTAAPGQYDIYVSGKKNGRANFVVWTNDDGSKRLIRADVEKPLLKMRDDIRNQIGESIRINSAFRSYEEQACMYQIYKECVLKWQQGGSIGLKPSAVANPETAGPNSHLTGVALDLATGVPREDIVGLSLSQIKQRISRGDFTKIWRWLVTNSEKYGYIWVGINFNEPWHFQFDKKLAKNAGLYDENVIGVLSQD